MRLNIVASHPIQYYAPIFRELASQVDLTVLFAHRQGPHQQADAGFGVEFTWDVDLLTGYKSSFLRNVSMVPGTTTFMGCDTPELTKILSNNRPDVVLVLGWYLKTFWQAIAWAKLCGTPVIVRGDSELTTPRSMIVKTGKRLSYPVILRLFDAALYVGQRSKQYYLHYGVPTSKLFHSPHCVDNDWFRARATPQHRTLLRKQLGILDDEKIVLFAGKLVKWKRPQDVLIAVRRLRDLGENARVVIAGSGPLELEMRELGISLGIEVSFLGFRNQSEMPSAYAAADVLALPSAHETWGLVVNEAVACGKPAVVSDAVGCAPDLIEAGAGRVFPMGDASAFAWALKEVLDACPKAQILRAVSDSHSVSAACAGIMAAASAVNASRPWRSPRVP